MIGRDIKFTEGAVVTRDASGAVYVPEAADRFRLVDAPPYEETVAVGADTAAMRVTLELLPGGMEAPEGCLLGSFSTTWGHSRHEANALLTAYLDDLKSPTSYTSSRG